MDIFSSPNFHILYNHKIQTYATLREVHQENESIDEKFYFQLGRIQDKKIKMAKN